MKAEVYYRCENEIGEAVTWLASGMLLWVDIANGMLYVCRPATGRVTIHRFPVPVSAIIPRENDPGEILLALQDEVISYRPATKESTSLYKFTDSFSGYRLNDCKASPEGRLWLGRMHQTDHKETGSLYYLDRQLQLHRILTHQSIPNGIVWNAGGTKMYYADSGRGCIEEYNYDRKNGSVSFSRCVVDVPPQYGIPDGMTIDVAGNLWVAHWGGYGVYVWEPETGTLIDKIDVPAPHVASCTFGGDDRKQLFITTARSGLSAEQLRNYPLSGSLFAVKTTVQAGENHYPFNPILK